MGRSTCLNLAHGPAAPLPPTPASGCRIVDGDVDITQTQAILRHVARKHAPALYGANIQEAARVDEAIEGAVDLAAVFVNKRVWGCQTGQGQGLGWAGGGANCGRPCLRMGKGGGAGRGWRGGGGVG